MNLAVKILQKEYDNYKRFLEKSYESYSKNDIDKKTHQIHLKNLIPKLNHLRIAINILENAFE